MRSARAAAGLLAAVAALLAAGLVGPGAAPAYAAGCTTATGVSVVVDYNELGDGLRAACVAGGGGSRAASLFPDAGFPLAYAQRSPGFVCRVTGVPTSDPCVDTAAANEHWSLWWSDGTSGTWAYSSLGVAGLRVPDGGYVAFAWHQGEGRAAAPDVAPTPREKPAAAPSGKPTSKPGRKPEHEPTKAPASQPTRAAAGQPTTGPTPLASATPSPTGAASTSPSATALAGQPSAVPTSPVSTPAVPGIGEVTEGAPRDGTAESADTPDEDGGVPAWLAVVLVVAVVGAGTVVAVRRRGAP